MRWQNIIVVDGKEIDLKELDEEKRMEIAERLNSRALEQLCYVKTEDQTA